MRPVLIGPLTGADWWRKRDAGGLAPFPKSQCLITLSVKPSKATYSKTDMGIRRERLRENGPEPVSRPCGVSVNHVHTLNGAIRNMA